MDGMSLFSATYLVPWLLSIPFVTHWYRVYRGDWKQWQPLAAGGGLTLLFVISDLTFGFYVPSWFFFGFLGLIRLRKTPPSVKRPFASSR